MANTFSHIGKLLIVLCMLAASPWLWAKVSVDGSFNQLDLSENWQYQKSQNFDNSMTPPQFGYQSVAPQPEMFTTYGNAYWFHIEIENASQQPLQRLLEIEHQHVRLATLWVYQNDKLLQHTTDGLAQPALADDLPTDHPVFNLTFEPGATLDLYLHVTSKDAMFWRTTLWSPKAFAKDLIDNRTLLAILFGAIIVMAIFNLVVAGITKESSYYYLGFFLTSLMLLQGVLHGMGSIYIWSNSPAINQYLIGPALMLFALSLVLFSQVFLKTPNQGLHRYLRIGVIAFTCVFIIPVGLAANAKVMVSSALIYVLPVLMIFGWATRMAWRGDRIAQHYLLAFSPLIVTIMALAANRTLGLGWPIESAQLLLLAGSALVALALAIALANRIRTLVQDQMRAEHAATVATFKVHEANTKAKAAEQAANAKSAFLATMSHEIRTPMNGVLGMADLLNQSELNKQQSAYVQTLRRCGQSLMAILNDILDYSKVESGHLSLEPMDVALDELIDDVVLLFRERINQAGIELYTWIEPDVPRHIHTDPTRLRQILSNLFSNSIKFTEQGSITLHIRMGSDSNRVTDLLEVNVTDTGVGMDGHALSTLFERFSQADSSISRRYGGTGLGLAICKSLVELMGGTISVQSIPNKGTTMTFTLDTPQVSGQQDTQFAAEVAYYGDDANTAEALRLWSVRQQGQFKRVSEDDLQALGAGTVFISDATVDVPPSASAPIQIGKDIPTPLSFSELEKLLKPEQIQPNTPTEAVPLSGMQVLVAEDNPVNRMVVGKILKNMGADVSFAKDGVEAVEKFESTEQDLDLILMDCEMPEMDGYAATLAIREASDIGAKLPIIAVTAHAMSEYRERAKEVGMTNYVTKPIDQAVLLEAIRSSCQLGDANT